jgi:acylphosphatase
VKDNDPAALRALVRGRVQGVGFRYFVQERAASRSLTGFARNLSDGRTVEVVAEGTREKLELLLEDLRAGAPLSYVERVDASWPDPTGQYASFSIR